MFLNWIVFCLSLIVVASANNDGTVRLYRNGVPDTSQSWSSGIVQIYYSSQWGNICDDYSFGSDEADVICHQLGYIGAVSYSNTGSTTIWGTDSSGTKLDDVSCSSSSYLTITQCSFSISYSSYCYSGDVTVSCYTTRIWDSPSSGDIRLTGGTYSSQGLLEVYCNGQWGTVCDDSFFSTEARIACRQLGYNYYVGYDHLSFQINASQSIWLNTVDSCSSSTDTCLSSCGACPATAITTCSHNEDVTLECRYSTSYSKVTDATNTRNCRHHTDTDPVPVGTVRLFRNGSPDTTQSWSSGIVQIYYNDQWGNICEDSSFGSEEADVICHQLGYTGASSYSNTGSTTIWGTDNSSTLINNVSCSSHTAYLTLTQCSFNTGISCSCDSTYDDVIVICYSTRIWSSPSSGDIRLTGSTYSNQGLLEVYCNGQWGTVCDDNFDSTAAIVACRQLGYNDYVSYDQLSIRGTSSQSIWLWYLSGCSSMSDSRLKNCGSCPSSAVTVCDHFEDVTLVCEFNSSYSDIHTNSSSNCDIDTIMSTTNATITDKASLSVGVVLGAVIGLIVCIIVLTIVLLCFCTSLAVKVRSTIRSLEIRIQIIAPPTTATDTPTKNTAPTLVQSVPTQSSENITSDVPSLALSKSVSDTHFLETSTKVPSQPQSPLLPLMKSPAEVNPKTPTYRSDQIPTEIHTVIPRLSQRSRSVESIISPSPRTRIDSPSIYDLELPISPNVAYCVPTSQSSSFVYKSPSMGNSPIDFSELPITANPAYCVPTSFSKSPTGFDSPNDDYPELSIVPKTAYFFQTPPKNRSIGSN